MKQPRQWLSGLHINIMYSCQQTARWLILAFPYFLVINDVDVTKEVTGYILKVTVPLYCKCLKQVYELYKLWKKSIQKKN